MYLSYTHALILQEIAAGKAELFTNSEPANFYIKDYQTGSDPIALDALWQFKQFGFVDEKRIDGYIFEYSISAKGIEELERYFPLI